MWRRAALINKMQDNKVIAINTRAKAVLEQDCYRSAMVVLNRKGGKMHFAPREWVPDEYETLERVGLVRCEFGRSDALNRALKSRDITLTEAGAIAADQIVDATIPSYVEYSFHSALARDKVRGVELR